MFGELRFPLWRSSWFSKLTTSFHSSGLVHVLWGVILVRACLCEHVCVRVCLLCVSESVCAHASFLAPLHIHFSSICASSSCNRIFPLCVRLNVRLSGMQHGIRTDCSVTCHSSANNVACLNLIKKTALLLERDFGELIQHNCIIKWDTAPTGHVRLTITLLFSFEYLSDLFRTIILINQPRPQLMI